MMMDDDDDDDDRGERSMHWNDSHGYHAHQFLFDRWLIQMRGMNYSGAISVKRFYFWIFPHF